MRNRPEGTAIIIGAGPAGLTAAYELQQRTDIIPIILESTNEIGGLSRTVRHNGNRMDIGGHRFFSKSDRVMKWWLNQLPLESESPSSDLVMLSRQRKSRIYFLRRFFDYPVTLSGSTIKSLGFVRTLRCGLSYSLTALLPKRQEHSLEDFFINRFGRELYHTFFRSYTEKVWGVSCSQISPEWGAQRVKTLSLGSAIKHFLKSLARPKNTAIAQNHTETSLIDRFLYPKFGPGQLWEHVAGAIERGGGQLLTGWTVVGLCTDGQRIASVDAVNAQGERRRIDADYCISSMPVPHLIAALDDSQTPIPASVREVASGLKYRDFITVGLLLDQDGVAFTKRNGGPLADTWLYIQEPDVLLGRLQIFNNWSPALTSTGKLWVGLEYFCNEGDSLWNLSDSEIVRLGIDELTKIGMLEPHTAQLDSHVVRVPKAYPAYFGSYDRFSTIKDFTDSFPNLFLVGRNGMHRYNNQDHSMLTAIQAVENICIGVLSKENIWSINTEQDYHEENSQQTESQAQTRYDYSNQAWIKDGKYVSCEHIKPCKCFGRIHEGEPVQANAEVHPAL